MVYELPVQCLDQLKNLKCSYTGTKLLLHFPAQFSFSLSVKSVLKLSCFSPSQSPRSLYFPQNLQFSLPKLHCFPSFFLNLRYPLKFIVEH